MTSAPTNPAAAPAAAAAADVLFAGAMPKEEIGALRFLSKNPYYDGRGVVIAIFDTGVDPGAPGLQVTSDGKPKIIDVVDCTGSGDIDTSKTVTADDEGFITGASGRRLRVSPSWSNPSGQWRVGCRRFFDLVPRPLQSRAKEERKKKFEERQCAALATASAALAAAPAGTAPAGTAPAGTAPAGTAPAGTAPAAAPAAAVAAPAAAPGGGLGGGEGNAAAEGEGGAAAPAAAAAAAPAPAPAPAPPRTELEARLSYLQDLMKGYDDPGPIIDAVVWHDGATWRAALDTAEVHAVWGDEGGAGALADHAPMADYRLERQWSCFSPVDSCNYALNVYGEGDTLSVVVDSGAHGTHVAGISAAFFPEDPGSNGVAPGAQIISCKIGDTRLGSMETGTALSRAAVAVVQHGAHLINMSFGEPAAVANQGRVIDIVTELVDRHGVIFVASAGNAGPALSTVGAPGGTSSALISVGAFVSPKVAAAGHSLRALGELGDGRQYTWSSRGPTADGEAGVTLSAPGGAIAPVPQWTTQRRQLMNGTSMSSPNACGGVALLLSGALAEGQKISPARVRRALENTCTPLGDQAGDGVLTYGRGMMQIDKAFDYLVRSSEVDGPGQRYVVSIAAGGPAGAAEPRGIYLREPHEGLAPRSFTVSVKPTLHEDAPTSDKLIIEDNIILRVTAPWVSAPELLLLHHNGRTFEVKVDPTGLTQGLHYAEVQGFCSKAEWRGPLFRVPITVIRPRRLAEAPAPPPPAASAVASGAAAAPGVTPPPDGESGGGGGALAFSAASGGGWAEGDSGGAPAPAPGAAAGAGASGQHHPPPYTLRLGPLLLDAGREVREFVAVPAGATWAEATFKGGEYDTPKMFLVRAAQLAPGSRYTWSEWRTNLTLSPTSEYSANFRIIGGSTLELTLAQFWSSLGAAAIEVEISFHGLQVDGTLGGRHGSPGCELALSGAAGASRATVLSPLRRQRLKPDAKLSALCLPLRPAETTLEPLGEVAQQGSCEPRDVLPGGRVVYRLLLTYKMTATEAGKYKPTLPLLNNTLYESPLESQMLMVFDANKKLVYTGDAYPESVQLPKGDYTLRLALRHESMELLEKLRGTCLVVERSIDPAVQVPVYTSHAAAVAGGAAAGEMFLGAGERVALWLGAPAEEKLPKDAKEGRVLKGKLTLGQLRRGSGSAPASHSISYVVPPAINKDATSNGGSSKKKEDEGAEEKKDAATKVAEALRDAKLSLMKEMRGEGDADAYDSLAQEVRTAFSGHLPLLLELLRRADALPKDQGAARLRRVVAAADEVVAAIDATALAAFTALRAPDPEAASSAPPGDASGAPSYKSQKKKWDEARAALLEALSKKLEALLDLADEEDKAPAGGPPATSASEALSTAASLRQWVDTASDAAYVMLHARVEARGGRLIAALKALDKADKAAEDDGKAPKKDTAERRAALLEQLGWSHWARHEAARTRLRFPSSYPPI